MRVVVVRVLQLGRKHNYHVLLSQLSTLSLYSTVDMQYPLRPQSRLTEFGLNLTRKLEPSKEIIFNHLNKEDGERQNNFLIIKELRSDITLATLELKNGDIDMTKKHLNIAYEKIDSLAALGEIPPQPQRSGSISNILEEIVFIHAYVDFFETGKLIQKTSLRDCIDDTEYISGILQFTNQLSEYCINRAMNNDIQSVLLCREIVQSIHGCLLSFDFRNGPLRRKFDGLKYQLKTIEDLLFEQSLLDKTSGEQNHDENVLKKSKLSSEESKITKVTTSSTEPVVVAAAAAELEAPKDEEEKISRVDINEFDVMRLRYEEVLGFIHTQREFIYFRVLHLIYSYLNHMCLCLS